MAPHPAYVRYVRAWIVSLIVLVALMVFIGGVTRLTESGLSIVEWKLLSGVFPPLSQQGWEAEFASYQASPEFQKKNYSFGVEEFKRIYWLEYIHRLLGRAVGLAFILPFGFFIVRRALPAPLIKRMAVATVLVGLQGAIGWVMVASGLVDAPRVNPIKLGLHLGLAFALFALLLWTWWQTGERSRDVLASHTLHRLMRVTGIILIVQIFLGALVAGNDAGLSYNSYPLMDGRIVPAGIGDAIVHGSPWYTHVMLVQFAHRVGAHALLLLIVILGWMGLRHANASLRHAAIYLFLACFIQFVLGVLTLIHAVPISLASAHQMAALALIAAFLNMRYIAAKPQPTTHAQPMA